MRLTDLSIRKFPVPEKGQRTYFDDALSGFGLRVSQGGARSFVVMRGKDRRLKTIGRYPVVSLKTARAEAQRLLAYGLPVVGRSLSYALATEAFLAECEEKNRKKTVTEYRRYLAFFDFGEKRLVDITRANIQGKLAKLKNTPAAQNHAFVAIRIFFNWALRNEYIDKQPIASAQKPAQVSARDHVLKEKELAEVLRRAQDYPAPFGPIVMLLVLSGQRRGEIAALEWEWIDEAERTITLPASLTKNKRSHCFPYGTMTDVVLAGLPRDGKFLFGNGRGTFFSGWSRAKKGFDRGLEVEPYTLHDVRRTFSSTLAMLGTPIHVTEKLLNHASGTLSGVAAIYNRHSYMAEMREAISAYEDYVQKLCKS